MKRIITLILLMCFVGASAQYRPQPFYFQYEGLRAVNILQLPTSSSASLPTYGDNGIARFNPVTGRLEFWRGSWIGTIPTLFSSSSSIDQGGFGFSITGGKLTKALSVIGPISSSQNFETNTVYDVSDNSNSLAAVFDNLTLNIKDSIPANSARSFYNTGSALNIVGQDFSRPYSKLKVAVSNYSAQFLLDSVRLDLLYGYSVSSPGGVTSSFHGSKVEKFISYFAPDVKGTDPNSTVDSAFAFYQAGANDINFFGGKTVLPITGSVLGTTIAGQIVATQSVANVRLFGAVGDGVSNDAAAFNMAKATGLPIYVPKGIYLLNSTIDIPSLTTIYGDGQSTVLKTSLNQPIISITGSGVTVSSLRFEGSGRGGAGNYSTANPLQHAVQIIGDTTVPDNFNKNTIKDCYFYNLGGAGFYIEQVIGDFHEGNLVMNCTAENCTWGFYCNVRGEYNSFVNCAATQCQIGLRRQGGNNNWIGGKLVDNRTGCYDEGGSNDGHSIVLGSAISHNIDYGIWSNGILYGNLYSGCMIYQNDIYMQGSDGVKLFGCDIIATSMFVQSSARCEVVSCKFLSATTFNLNWNGTNNTGSLSDISFSGNKYFGTPPTTIFGETEVGGIKIKVGNGSPEGVVTAQIGSMYSRKDGGAGTTLYIKESGSGNTGWIAK